MREAGKRTLGQRHFDVQLLGGLVLNQGDISKIKGTISQSNYSLYLNALEAIPDQVNTALKKNGDIEEIAKVFKDATNFHQPNSQERKNAYNADITYGTNNEFGFDYLRDNMAHTPADLVQRPHHYAIVDEIDSVLIDDARTPLIISGPIPQGDRHEFMELKPKVEDIVGIQRKYLTGILAEAKKIT